MKNDVKTGKAELFGVNLGVNEKRGIVLMLLNY